MLARGMPITCKHCSGAHLSFQCPGLADGRHAEIERVRSAMSAAAPENDRGAAGAKGKGATKGAGKGKPGAGGKAPRPPAPLRDPEDPTGEHRRNAKGKKFKASAGVLLFANLSTSVTSCCSWASRSSRTRAWSR